jgi:DNA-binding NtrC family response regulator
MGKPIPTFTESAIEELKKQPWTGNIRELQNVVGRLVILCGPTISAEDVKKYL